MVVPMLPRATLVGIDEKEREELRKSEVRVNDTSSDGGGGERFPGRSLHPRKAPRQIHRHRRTSDHRTEIVRVAFAL